MQHIALATWLACSGLAALVPAVASAAEPELRSSPVVIPGAEQFDLRSKSGLDYRIFVAAPPGAPPDGGFPVIYLTDANGNFPVVLAAVRRQSLGEAAALVVGIGYPSDDRREQSERRWFDLTPAASAAWLRSLPSGGPAIGKTGGIDDFLRFIEEELKPRIESRYSVDRRRQTLLGHSFGGLFVLHVLFSQPECFQTYLASSPSIWWNDASILAEQRAFVERVAERGIAARLLVTVGEWEETPGPGVPSERAQMLRERRMVTRARTLAESLQSATIHGLTVAHRVFDEEDHGSVFLPAASRGVRFALAP